MFEKLSRITGSTIVLTLLTTFLFFVPSTLLTLLILLLFPFSFFHSLFGLLRFFVHEILRLSCEIFEFCIGLVRIEILGVSLSILCLLFHLFFCILTSFLNTLPIHILEPITWKPLTKIFSLFRLRRIRITLLLFRLLSFWVLFART